MFGKNRVTLNPKLIITVWGNEIKIYKIILKYSQNKTNIAVIFCVRKPIIWRIDSFTIDYSIVEISILFEY